MKVDDSYLNVIKAKWWKWIFRRWKYYVKAIWLRNKLSQATKN